MPDAIARVLSGWSGNIEVAGYQVGPRQRESAMALMARVVAHVYAASLAATGVALTLTLTVSAGGVLTLTGDAVYVLTATGTTRTRLGWTGTYTGASTYTAAAAIASGHVPAHGLQLDLAAPWQSEGSPAADGLMAWTGPEQTTRSVLSLWTTYSDAWAAELLAGEWDVWAGSRMLGRVFVERFSRVPVSRLLRSGMMEVRGEGVSVYVEEGIPAEIPQAWPAARGWLYSWVDTAAPGYRALDVNALGALTVPAAYQRWDDYVRALEIQVEILAAPTRVSIRPDGRVRFLAGSVTDILTWTDRMGWLLGYGAEAGVVDTEWDTTGAALSRYVPPGGIPLLSCSWTEVEVACDAEAILDRHRKRHGYVYGAARLWTVRATMTRWALQALMTGWCLRGQLTAVALDDIDAIGPAQPGGAITGHVLGLDRVSWLEPEHQRTAVVVLTIATEGA